MLMPGVNKSSVTFSHSAVISHTFTSCSEVSDVFKVGWDPDSCTEAISGRVRVVEERGEGW